MMETPFVPDSTDMLRMVRAFCSVHVDNVKDEVGPNKPDAPFFERLASQDDIAYSDYLEIGERLHKYTNTQIPSIAHLAGYPADVNWVTAIHHIKMKGMEEKAKNSLADAWLEAKYKDDVNSVSADYLADNIVYLVQNMNVQAYAAGSMVRKWVDKVTDEIQQQSLIRLIYANQFMNEYNGRQYPRIQVRTAERNSAFYNTLKEILDPLRKTMRGLPFMYEGAPAYRISIMDEKTVIRTAMDGLHRLGYNVAELEQFLDNATEQEAFSASPVSATLVKNGVALSFPYDKEMVATVRSIPKRKWNNDSKCWMVPLSSIAQAIDRLESCGLPNSKELVSAINQIPETANYIRSHAERVALSGAADMTDEQRIQEIDSRLAEVFPPGHQLYPFQRVGVRFAELANGRCLIGDDMGIGKTIQALAYIALHPEHHPALVVCPANVKFNWLREVRKWLPSFDVGIVRSGIDPIMSHDITIINYDLVSKQKKKLAVWNYKTVVFDECHYLKNSKAARTIACKELAKSADSLLALSGTPISNKPIELFNVLNMINPSEWNFWEYAHKYCDAHETYFGLDTTGASNQQELHERLRDTMIRRLKKEVMEELPDKVRQTVELQPSETHMKVYRKERARWVSQYKALRAAGSLPAGFLLNMLTELRKQCGRIKAHYAVEWVKEYRAQNDKPLIVFAHHREVVQTIADGLNGEVPVVHRITGETPAEDRTDIVERFQNDEIDVLICSTIAAKEGLTLTQADTVLFVEREWVPAYEEQAEDRVNRIGQDNDTVWAVYLSIRDTVDARFAALVEGKRNLIKSIVDGGEVGTRNQIINELLQDMVQSGELPITMLQDLTGGTA